MAAAKTIGDRAHTGDAKTEIFRLTGDTERMQQATGEQCDTE